jgi:hypothetical protein
MVSEKMIEDDLSWVEESATKSTYKLGVGFERCEGKGEKRAPKFVPTSNYHKEEETVKSTKTNYPSSPKPSFNPKREVRKETPKPREEAFIWMFCGRAGHLDEFCFCRKRIEKMRFDYAINSYRDEFTNFLVTPRVTKSFITFIRLLNNRIRMNLNQLLRASQENLKTLNSKFFSWVDVSSKCKQELLVQVSSILANPNQILSNFIEIQSLELPWILIQCLSWILKCSNNKSSSLFKSLQIHILFGSFRAREGIFWTVVNLD